ncbi:MAG: helix-turn-helix domain-containing protein [Geobacter sp.]|nr:MAG: helix-turn-helix domain-containing protein [Geobacter sp.]
MGADFYTLKELADKLEVSTRTVQRMVDRGELKEGADFYRLGRSLRFVKASVIPKYHLREE